MVLVLLQVGVPQVQVFQASVCPVAVVRVGTCHVADDGEVLTIQRTADGQRVILRIGPLDVAYFAALLHHCQTELVGQLTCLGDGHYLIYIRNTLYDIVGIFAPRRLVVGHLACGYIDLQAIVLVERAGADGGGHVAQDADAVQIRTAGEGIFADGGHALWQLNLLQGGAALEGLLADVGDGGRQQDVTHIRAVLEPRLTHIVKTYTLEMLEVAERIDVILLVSKLTVQP